MRDLHPTPYRTHISSYDFETAGAFIEAARKYEPSDIEYEALLESAVIRYARPFSPNERKENSQADSRISVNIEKVFESQADIEFHKRVITLRNKVVAHAESSFFPTKLLDPVGTSRARGFAVTSTRWHIHKENIDLNAFVRIAEKMRMACINQMCDWAGKPEAENPSTTDKSKATMPTFDEVQLGQLQSVTDGHGFSILNKHWAPVATLTYKTHAAASEAHQAIAKALEKVSSVTIP